MMNIYEKLSAITNEITAVAKNLNVGWGKSSYKAAGEADILAAVKPIEEKHRIYSYPYDREILETAVLTTIKPDGTEGKQQFMRVRTTYRFVDMDKPDDFIDIISYGDGVDPQDKAPGKAMTYADKYALMKAYKIITGDDPDQYYSDGLKDKKPKAAVPQTSMATDAQKATIKDLCGKFGVNYEKFLVQKKSTEDTLSAEVAGQMLLQLKRLENGTNRQA